METWGNIGSCLFNCFAYANIPSGVYIRIYTKFSHHNIIGIIFRPVEDCINVMNCFHFVFLKVSKG